ncbi:G-type lectin S-receptor-like serine/threonine-protein kinase LECRK1 [Benincasa hispida]|uniref:G-type lectin S-receptor-like serine/threonine-protein kinase LECRK1 n=1 Tax=Benincasa hispida TaxID=102211 RepID=UPI0019002D79|nr:G-type lectin S-receptor-like serine/threonine-protein kinase LECRK1 [Benincasa hispida]
MASMIFLSFVLLNFYKCLAQNGSPISRGSSIAAGSNHTWLSPSGDFAFGFYRLPNNLYLVGIWFDKIPQTLVWSANRDNPAPPNSLVKLNRTGQFVLSFPNGIIIQPIFKEQQAPASSGQMQDDGNFVLKDSNFVAVGQSFDSPTDTLLPGQILGVDKKMFSAKNISDFSTGNFMLQMQKDGNLVLSNYHFSNVGYWFTIATNIENTVLVFDKSSALMYLTNRINPNGQSLRNLTVNVPAPVGDYYHRATINVHGDFRQYVYPKSNGSEWIKVWGAMRDPCLVNTVCGLNGLCKSPDNDTVTCDCLPGFVHLDPADAWKGCRPETVINYCMGDSGKNFTLQVIEDVDIDLPPESEPFSDLVRMFNVDFESCKRAIMEDCYVMAATWKNSTCLKKRTPLMNGRNTNITKGTKTLIRVPLFFKNSSEVHDGKNENNFNYRKVLEIGNIIAGVLAFCFGAVVVFYHPTARRLIRRKNFLSASAIGINFREFTFQELVDATDGFKKILGQGSSCKVVRGNLHIDGIDVEIAVKVLDKMTERTETEFVTELRIIGRTYHTNLVRLLGYCIENKKQLLLVYELMPNGALSRFLFDNGENMGALSRFLFDNGENTIKISNCNWTQRVEIAKGIARGLAYLHEECETQIIHCDVKPQNVLLDANYAAKIADFGISKLLKKDQTRTNTEARGTAGYMAPEWLRGAPVTAKVDVYSYGVMLLEIICCRRHIELDRVEEESEEEDLVLSNWVLSRAAAGNLETVVGDKAEILMDFERFKRMAMVGLWCIHPDASQRPSMKKVTQMLEGTAEVGTPPLLLCS